MNKNIPDVENVTDAVSDEYKKTKRLLRDLKNATCSSDITMGFSMPGEKKREFTCSSSIPAIKAAVILTLITVSIIAVIAFHIKMICGKMKR